MIGAFYGLGTDSFANTEYIWEGVLGIVASIIISVMGGALLRVSKMQDKWRVKLAKALEHKEDGDGQQQQSRIKTWMEKYAMFFLPFITVLREGLEAVIYVGGVGLGQPATAFPLAVVCGLAAGILVGYIIYRYAIIPRRDTTASRYRKLTCLRFGQTTSMQIFLVISTGFLYLVAAGLLSRGVWYFEANTWNKVIGGDAAETGAGPGSYDIRQSVWHVNCCSPEINGGGGWGIFNSLLGWTNSATYGSVISYNLYWVCVMVCYGLMIYRERSGPIAVIDPALDRIAGYKAKTKAAILRRPVDTETHPGNQVVGSVEEGKSGQGSAVRQTEI